MANEQSAKVVVNVETVLRNLDRTVKGLDSLEAKLQRLGKIKVGEAATSRTQATLHKLQATQKHQEKVSQSVLTSQKKIAAGELSMSRQLSAVASLQRQRSAALLRDWKLQEKAARNAAAGVRPFRDVIQSLSTSLATLQGPLGPLSGRLSSFGTLMSGVATKTGGLVLGLGAILAATAGAAIGISKLVISSAEAEGKLHDLSKQTGFSVETLSGLQNAAETSGGSIDTVSNSLFFFETKMGEAKDEASEMSKIFKTLGIDTSNNEKALRQALTALLSMTEAETKATFGKKLFGRSVKDLLGVLAEAGGLDAFLNKQLEQGTLITTEAARRGDKLTDTITILGQKLLALGRIAAREFEPLVSDALSQFSKWLRDNQKELISTTKEVARLVRDIADLSSFIFSISPIKLQIDIVRNIKTIAQDFFPADTGGPAAGKSLFDRLRESINRGPVPTGSRGALVPVDLSKAPNQTAAQINATAKANADAARKAAADQKKLLDSLRGVGKGRGGRGGRQRGIPADTFDSELDVRRANAEAAFNLEKDLIARLTQIYETALDDRKIATEDFFSATALLREREIKAEIALQNELQRIAEDRLAAEKKKIAADRQTTPEQKAALVTNAENRFLSASASIAERIRILSRDLGDLPSKTAAAEQTALTSLESEITDFLALVDAANNKTAASAAAAIDREFLPLLEKVIAEQGENSPLVKLIKEFIELQKALPRIDQLEQQRAVVGQQLDIERLNVESQVAQKVLTQREGREKINALQREYLEKQLVILKNELSITATDQQRLDVLQRIAATQNEIANITEEVNQAAIDINEQIFSDIESGFENIFNSALHGIDAVKQAALDLGKSLLATLNRIAAESLAKEIFGGIFKPGEENEGGIGGTLSRLFGLAPKDSPATVANTTATDANTAAINANTAILGGEAPQQDIIEKAKSDPLGTFKKVVGFFGGLFGGGGAGEEESESDEGEDESEVPVGGLEGLLGLGGLTPTIAQQGSTVLETLNIIADLIGQVIDAIRANTAALTDGQDGALSGLAGLFGGEEAAGDYLPASPGGKLIRVAEGGYGEAVLTTDPKHALRQVAILREYLNHTKGLFGRFKVPEFAEGGFISPREAEMNMLNSIERTSPIRPDLSDAVLAGASSPPRNFRAIFVDDERSIRNWHNSPEGDEVWVQKLIRNRPLIRRLSGK